MYRLGNMLDKSPSIISAAIFALVNFLAGCVFVIQHIKPSPEFAGLMLQGETALVLLLSLFVVQTNTVTNSQAAAQADQAAMQTENNIVKYLATATDPPVAPEVVQDVVDAKPAQAAAKAANATKKAAKT